MKAACRSLLAALLALCASTAPSAAAAGGAPMAHTPWLGLRFVQGGAEVRLERIDLRRTAVRLRRRPFEILLPTRGPDDVYWIAAWTDDSIFAEAPVGADLTSWDEGGYFNLGTGIADTAAGSGTLFLRPDGHNHLSGLRLGPDPARHRLFVSTLFRDRREYSVGQVAGPIYLVAFYDEDHDNVVDREELDFLVLRFDR